MQMRRIYVAVLFALAVALGLLNVFFRRSQARDMLAERPALRARKADAAAAEISGPALFSKAQLLRVREHYQQRADEPQHDGAELQQLLTVLLRREKTTPSAPFLNYSAVDPQLDARITDAVAKFNTFCALELIINPLVDSSSAFAPASKVKAAVLGSSWVYKAIRGSLIQIGVGSERTMFADALSQRLASAFDFGVLLWDTNISALRAAALAHKSRNPNLLRAVPSFQAIASVDGNSAILRAKESGSFAIDALHTSASVAAATFEPSGSKTAHTGQPVSANAEDAAAREGGEEGGELHPVTIDAAARFVGARHVAVLAVHSLLDGEYDQLTSLLSANLAQMQPFVVLLHARAEREKRNTPMIALCRALLRRFAGYRQVPDEAGLLGEYELWESPFVRAIKRSLKRRAGMQAACDLARGRILGANLMREDRATTEFRAEAIERTTDKLRERRERRRADNAEHKAREDAHGKRKR